MDVVDVVGMVDAVGEVGEVEDLAGDSIRQITFKNAGIQHPQTAHH